MKLTSLASALAIGLVAAAATSASAQSRPSPVDRDASTINISCYRGWAATVAWDRPNAVFIEDLVALGYSRQQAYVIGERVCKDEYGVRSPDYQIQSLRAILAEGIR